VLPRSRAGGVSLGERAGICAVVAAAAAFRFTAIGAGVPAAVASDEPFVMERAFAMMTTGDFNPHVFDYPSLYIYLQAAVASVRFLVGTLRGEWYQLDQVSASDFYVWGRLLTALLGTLTVVLTWRIGRRIGVATGLLAAAFLAVQPLHVRESHFVLTDVPMTFFVALTLLASVRAFESPSAQSFALSGAAAGLAAATKYTGGIVLLVPLVALVMAPWDLASRARTVLVVAGAAVLAFLAGAPYSLLDLPGFLNGFGALARGHAAGVSPDTSPWWTYLLHLRLNLGRPLLAVSIAGLVAGVVQAFRSEPPARVVWATTVVFTLVFYAEIADQTLVWGRYLLPILPALFILGAGTVELALGRWRDAFRLPVLRWAAAAAAVVLLFAPGTLRSWTLVAAMAKTSSNGLAYAWIVRELPPGARVAVEAEGMKLPVRFRAHNVQRLIDHTYEDYLENGTEYLVASSLASRGAMAGGSSPDGRAYLELFRSAQLVHAVTPTPENPGSEIRVYRVIRPTP
jgi:4-amino-4-deoxy-L-arabinose transferase-like glycosyltransferase